MVKLGVVALCLFTASLALGTQTAPQTAGGPKFKGAWTDPEDKTLPPDFKLQGEYVGQFTSGGKLGAQVISLGKDSFQAVLFIGGLPGDGWDGQNKILMDGKRDEAKVSLKPPSGK